MKCSSCGKEHSILEPAFARPDVIFDLTKDDRAARVKESDDLCTLRTEAGEAPRHFVRCVLPVEITDQESDSAWGLWVELTTSDFKIVVDNWRNPDQANLPPMPATVANNIRGYPATIGLRATLHLTGLTTRARIELAENTQHPFVREIRDGVTLHKLDSWLHRQNG